jgi:protocatechuate 3,4-dioxygenase beta subunit
MKRKEFIKTLGLGSVIIPLVAACGKDNDPTSDSTTDSTASGSCTVSPSETAGPFPTKTPASFVIEDIRSDRTGIQMTVNITIQNKNNGCSPMEGAIVDIWHCDKDGYYSEYGGSGMQSVNLTGVHFLRGRQTTDANGVVSFVTIFPGWYSGRAPHIHVHVYDSTGKSLLVTQIAFPTDVCNSVYTTATEFYTKGKQDTANTADNIFADSLSSELAVVTGSVNNGFVLSQTVVVSDDL